MIARPLGDLLLQLRERVQHEPQRLDAEREQKASALAANLPLVHRTAPPQHPGVWRTILESGAIRAGKPHTEREERLGSKQTAYFFLGHPAWPTGLAAFLVKAGEDVLAHATFTPFDSGGLTKHVEPLDPTASKLDEAAKEGILASHTGAGVELKVFAAAFIATHLREPSAYVSRTRFEPPDWAPFHGLRSLVPPRDASNPVQESATSHPEVGDRRSWTIEVQVHGDVPLAPAAERLEALVIAGKDTTLVLPDDIFGLCTQVETEDDLPSEVIRHILNPSPKQEKPS